mmetsp:Transcript_17271/g.43094  ORF Transcript_17271/g.43094 Transcript_17271/m.43094 type:complete len:216 (-) Transcript_17271:137-784(-)
MGQFSLPSVGKFVQPKNLSEPFSRDHALGSVMVLGRDGIHQFQMIGKRQIECDDQSKDRSQDVTFRDNAWGNHDRSLVCVALVGGVGNARNVRVAFDLSSFGFRLMILPINFGILMQGGSLLGIRNALVERTGGAFAHGIRESSFVGARNAQGFHQIRYSFVVLSRFDAGCRSIIQLLGVHVVPLTLAIVISDFLTGHGNVVHSAQLCALAFKLL